MAYVTVYNAKKMIRELDPNELISIVEKVYKRDIYFFSKKEEANLKGLRELFRNPENFLYQYYHRIEIVDSLKYVFPEKQPAFHKDSTCARLNSNYLNIEVPLPIQEKGATEVTKFREWFLGINYKELTPKQIIEKIQLKFPYVGEMNPKEVEYANSGVEQKENYSLDELVNKIDSLLSEADKYFDENPNLRELIVRYQKLTFLAAFNKPIDDSYGLTGNQIKSFLRSYEQKFKAPIKRYLTEYYRLLFNPSMTFDGELLPKLGFIRCSKCL